MIEVVAPEKKKESITEKPGKTQPRIPDERDKAAWCEWYGRVAVAQFHNAGCTREGGAWNDDPKVHRNFCMERGIEAAKNEIKRRQRPGAAWGKYGDMQSCRDKRAGEY